MNQPTPMAVPRETERVDLLDLLRPIAALMVVMVHYSVDSQKYTMRQYGHPELATVFQYGYLGVPLFFIISGFVIPMTARRGAGIHFVASRLSRLYPAFWFCCLATYAVCKWAGPPARQVDVGQLLANLTMLPQLFRAPLVDDVYWTLYVEMKFYVLVFLAMKFASFDRYEICLRWWCALIVTAMWWDHKVLDTVFISHDAAAFILGGVYWLSWSKGWNRARAGLAVVAMIVLMYRGVLRGILHAKNFELADPTVPIAVILLFLGVSNLVFLAFSSGWLKPRCPWAAKFGSLTYPLYLVHGQIGFVLIDRLTLGKHATLLVAVAVAIMLAWCIHHAVERPLGKRFRTLIINAWTVVSGLALGRRITGKGVDAEPGTKH